MRPAFDNFLAPTYFSPPRSSNEESLHAIYESPELLNEELPGFEYPLYIAEDEEMDYFLGRLARNVGRAVHDTGGWIGNAAKSAGHAVGSVAHAVADVSSSVADALGKVPLIGPGLKGLYGYTYGALIQSADNVVSGVRLDKVVSRHFESQIKNIKEVAPYVQTIISVVPGIGPGVSGAISAGLSLAQGKSIDEALVDAVAGSLPGGALAESMAKMAFAAASGKPLTDIAVSALPIPPAAKDALKAGLRVASDVAQGKRVDRALLAEANRQIDRLPPGFRNAAQVGIALGQGKKLQDIAIEQLPRLIAVGGPLEAAGKKIALNSPLVRQARELVAKGQHGFDVAQGLMAHSGVPQYQIDRARKAFRGEALKGFDTAVALHLGRVLSPPRRFKKGPHAAHAGYFVMKGLQGAPPAKIASLAKTVAAANLNAKAGAKVALKELIDKTEVPKPVERLPPDSWSYDAPGPPHAGNRTDSPASSGQWHRRDGQIILVGV